MTLDNDPLSFEGFQYGCNPHKVRIDIRATQSGRATPRRIKNLDSFHILFLFNL
jgi:hypothetical protein